MFAVITGKRPPTQPETCPYTYRSYANIWEIAKDGWETEPMRRPPMQEIALRLERALGVHSPANNTAPIYGHVTSLCRAKTSCINIFLSLGFQSALLKVIPRLRQLTLTTIVLTSVKYPNLGRTIQTPYQYLLRPLLHLPCMMKPQSQCWIYQVLITEVACTWPLLEPTSGCSQVSLSFAQTFIMGI